MHALRACVRGVNNYPKRIYCTMNPGGVGHGWVKRLFIDRQYLGAERAEDYSFIRSLVTDNAALMASDPDYLRSLQALPDKSRCARGSTATGTSTKASFSRISGSRPTSSLPRRRGFAADSDESRRQRRFTHVIEPFDLAAPRLPRLDGVPRLRLRLRASVLLRGGRWTTTEDYTEFLNIMDARHSRIQGPRLSPDEQFREIARMEREHPWLRGRSIDGVADPSIWDASRGESVAETAARYGLYFLPGDNHRVPGWMQCHYRLQFDEGGRWGCTCSRVRGVSAHGAAAAVLGGAAGGRGHGAGGSRGGRVAVRVHVAADRAADRVAAPARVWNPLEG